jgi:hypothetical protein
MRYKGNEYSDCKRRKNVIHEENITKIRKDVKQKFK